MDPVILSSLLSAGSSAVGSVAGLIGQGEAQRFQSSEAAKARNFAADQAQLERDFNLEMWNKNNEYNDPSAELSRLLATGMNPSTALGMMSGQNSVAQLASSSASPAGIAAAGVGNSAGEIAAGLIGGIPRSIADVYKTMQEGKGQELINRFTPEQQRKIIDKMNAEISKLEEDKAVSHETAEQIRKLTPKLVNLKEAEYQEIHKAMQEADKRISVMDKQIEEIGENILRIKADTVLSYAKAGNERAQAMLAKKQADSIDPNTMLDIKREELEGLKKENWLKDFTNYWAEKGVNPNLDGMTELFNYLKVMVAAPNTTIGDVQKFANMLFNGEPSEAIKFAVKQCKVKFDKVIPYTDEKGSKKVSENSQKLDNSYVKNE